MAKFDGSNDTTGPTAPLENECVAKEILSVSGYGDGDGSVRAMMMI
jgi:hypothetical protein